ncbi:MAG: hypothetical protein ACLFSA_12100, partial [Spirochaetaceae bacterium]
KGLYLNASSDIDSSFREEVDEIIDRSLKAADKKNRRDMLECRVALETVVKELVSIQQEQEVGFGRA